MNHTCGRRAESGAAMSTEKDADFYREDGTCSYCGSLNPDVLMARLEAGTVKLGSTDKNYKVYVENDGGEQFKQTYRDCPKDTETVGNNGNRYMTCSCKEPGTCTHWVTREVNGTKFYFQHFSPEQQKRFIELLNQKKVKFEGGLGFYVWPFFCCRAPKNTR